MWETPLKVLINCDVQSWSNESGTSWKFCHALDSLATKILIKSHTVMLFKILLFNFKNPVDRHLEPKWSFVHLRPFWILANHQVCNIAMGLFTNFIDSKEERRMGFMRCAWISTFREGVLRKSTMTQNFPPFWDWNV